MFFRFVFFLSLLVVDLIQNQEKFNDHQTNEWRDKKHRIIRNFSIRSKSFQVQGLYLCIFFVCSADQEKIIDFDIDSILCLWFFLNFFTVVLKSTMSPQSAFLFIGILVVVLVNSAQGIFDGKKEKIHIYKQVPHPVHIVKKYPVKYPVYIPVKSKPIYKKVEVPVKVPYKVIQVWISFKFSPFIIIDSTGSNQSTNQGSISSQNSCSISSQSTSLCQEIR